MKELICDYLFNDEMKAKVVKELNDLTDDMNYIKGIVSRLNGKH